ncbi:MAG: galactokinase [bacterium]
MKALILCAGYATRLYPLTFNTPKHLLSIANKPMINYIIEKIQKIDEIDSIYLVTNEKFYHQFKDWAKTITSQKKIKILNDKTQYDSKKLGAIGDINFVIDKEKIKDDLLIIAGDNLFELDLKKFIDFFNQKGTSIGIYDVGEKNIDLMKQYSEVELDAKNKVIFFTEKPKKPKTTLASICIYLFPKEKLKLIKQYLKEGHNPDQPGQYIEWLYKKEAIFGFITSEKWYDIGNLEQYKKANIEKLKIIFKKTFGKGSVKTFRCPGRINIIGEHTDYNNGYVLPINIDKEMYLCVRKRKDKIVNLHSLNYTQKIKFSLNEKIIYEKNDGWANYIKGCIKILQDQGYKFTGVDLLYSSNIPIASGLSSSAAIEVITCFCLSSIFNLKIDKLKIVKMCQLVENKFMKIDSGIMDQFVIIFSKKNKSLFLNCKNYKFELINFDFKDVNIVITNTKVKRELVFSEYNKRCLECQQGVKIFKKHFKNIQSLSDISIQNFEQYKNFLPEIIKKRCEHVIYENERTKKAVEYLKNENIIELGKLLNQSHNSLKNLYEVSLQELNIIVEESMKIEGVFGSRMTGAGFGGCVISLVQKDKIEEFIKKISEKYKKKFGYLPEFYICKSENGVSKI